MPEAMDLGESHVEPLSALLGFAVEEVGEGTATVRATVEPDHTNMHGTAHGGFVFSLADTAFALASNSRGARALALAADIHFTRPARPGDTLVAEATERSLGPRTATYDVSVRSSEGLVALFTGTVYRSSPGTPPRPEAAGGADATRGETTP